MSGYIGFPNADKNLTNLINGTISTSNWTTNNTYSSLSLISTTTGSYLCLKSNSTGTSATRYAYQNLATTIAESSTNIVKVYFQAKVRGDTNNNRSTPQILRLYSSSTESIANTDWEGNSGTQLNTDTWHTMSGIIDNSNKQIKGIGFQITSPYQNDKIYFKDIIVVNLTDTFGNGKEPTKQQCDENIILENGEISYQGTTTGRGQLIKNMYIGIDGIAHKIRTAYVGVNNVAQEWYRKNYSYKRIFESIDAFDIWPQTATTSAKYPGSGLGTTYPKAYSGMLAPAVGQTWFLFYCVGNSLEIDKIVLTSSSAMTNERIRLIPTNSSYTLTFDSSTYRHEGSTKTTGGFLLFLHFNLDANLIEEQFRNETITLLNGTQYSSGQIVSFSNSSSQGIIFSIFSDVPTNDTVPKYGLWGAINAREGITSNIIRGGGYSRPTSNSSSEVISFLSSNNLIKVSNTNYTLNNPLNTNTSYPDVKTFGYTLIHFQD